MEQFKGYFASGKESTSTLFKTFNTSLQRDLIKIKDPDTNTKKKDLTHEIIKDRLEQLQNNTISTWEKVEENVLSQYKQVFPIKTEINLCKDEFS